MGKTRKRGGSRRKRGGAFAALQNIMNKAHAGLTDATRKMKEEAEKAHRATTDMINKGHQEATKALQQVKKTTHDAAATVQQQAAKAQGALVSGAHSVEKKAGEVAKVGGRRRRHRTHRRKRRRKHRRTHRRHRRRTHRRRR